MFRFSYFQSEKVLPKNENHFNSVLYQQEQPPTKKIIHVESFLPSIPTSSNSNDGHRPYRRNDFAHNHLFIAKQKLARIFLNQPPTDVQSRNDLIHLFDSDKSHQKYAGIKSNRIQV